MIRPHVIYLITVNSGLPLNPNVEIELSQYKITIDQRFCVENSCDPRRGLYTLFIPISPTFPMIPLQIYFKQVSICTLNYPIYQF